MISRVYASYGKQINKILNGSSGSSNRADEFRRSFINKEVIELEGLPVDFHDFLQKFLLIIELMRKPCGATLKQLSFETQLSEREVRVCIRILIDIGGDVELKKRGQGMAAGRFILHEA